MCPCAIDMWDRSIIVDPFSYFSFQAVLQDIKCPLLLIENRNLVMAAA